MTHQEGGCLCGECRYEVSAEPLRVTTCHCRFCQKATGSAYMIEPVFANIDFRISQGVPRIWSQLSEGSGKHLWLHFCATCGTRLYLSFERFDQVVGVYSGTFDDPDWFDITPENSKQIFLSAARRGTVIPAHIETYAEHITDRDGTPRQATVFDVPRRI